MPTKKRYLKGYRTRREAEACVDGLVLAGWSAHDVTVEEEPSASRWNIEFAVYRLEDMAPTPPAPTLTPRRRFIR